MRFHIPNLHDEGLHTVVVVEGNTACEDNRMGREQAERAWPELRRFYRRCMYHKLLSLLIICGRGFDSCNIRSVAEFRLRVAPYNVQVVRLRQVVRFLLFAGEQVQAIDEHHLVEGDGRLSREDKRPSGLLLLRARRVLCNQMVHLFRLHDDSVAAPPFNHLLSSGHLVIVYTTYELRMLIQVATDHADIVYHFLAEQEVSHLFLIKIALGTLFEQVRVNDTQADAASQTRVKLLRTQIVPLCFLDHLQLFYDLVLNI